MLDITQLNPTDELRYRLLGSFLEFTRYFYKIRTGRKFEISQPIGRESHHITIAKALTKVFRLETTRLIINIPPRYGKTELLIHFLAWIIAHYPDSNCIYTSYAKSLASIQTSILRQIIESPEYKRLFNYVSLSEDTNSKDFFITNKGGSIFAAGVDGPILGRGAGVTNVFDHISGVFVVDDYIKIKDALSDVIRESSNNWFLNTVNNRLNTPKTPVIVIMQRSHEEDLSGKLLQGFDGEEWETIILPALDENGYALDPSKHTAEKLRRMLEVDPYNTSAIFQQNPQPPGGLLYKREWFVIHDEIPQNIFATFITVDTAETEKTYNDATVFSFWGVYEVYQQGISTNVLAIHWLDCMQLWCEPKDLKQNFLNFWTDCCRFRLHPKYCYIEKKSTGVTLLSVLKDMVGINAIEIERNNQLSKSNRFVDAQSFIAAKKVSFTKDARHVEMCLKHMEKITPNNTHANDDIADTCADAINLALAEEIFKPEEILPAVNLYGGQRIVLGG